MRCTGTGQCRAVREIWPLTVFTNRGGGLSQVHLIPGMLPLRLFVRWPPLPASRLPFFRFLRFLPLLCRISRRLARLSG